MCIRDSVCTDAGSYIETKGGWKLRADTKKDNDFTHEQAVQNYWYTTMGENYVEKAFSFARKYADDLSLIHIYPVDNAVIGTMIGCFQNEDAVGKIQQGSAWWFNDHKYGMTQQITSLASLGLLGNFIGMLTLSLIHIYRSAQHGSCDID